MPRAAHSYLGLTKEDHDAVETKTATYFNEAWEAGTHANKNRTERYYEEFCLTKGVPAWPADPKVVATFLVAEVERLKSVASLDNFHSHIRVRSRFASGTEWSKPEEAYMAAVKRGLRKRYPHEVKRKRPITLAVLANLVGALDLKVLKNFQFATMMFVAHDAALRLKELLELRWSDIEFVTSPEGQPELLRIRVRVSKSRYGEASETLEIAPYTMAGRPASAVHFLWAYMQDPEVQARATEGQESFLFPNVRARSGIQPRETFVSWVRARLQSAGYSSAEYSGHSFRAGGATDLHKGNAPEVVARSLGRWRSRETYLIYIRLDPAHRAAEVSEAFVAAFDNALEMGESAAERYVDRYYAQP